MFRQTEDGIHLQNSILWFDSKKSGEVSFLSSIQDGAHKSRSRIISAEETMRALTAINKAPDALVCQYNRPFAIGPLCLEIIPSGAGLGSSSLYIETNNRSILYAPHIQTTCQNISRRAQLKPAETLLLHARSPFKSDGLSSRKKETLRLSEKIASYVQKNQFPIIFCEPYSTSAVLIKLLNTLDVDVEVSSKNMYRILNIYKECGYDLGKFSFLTRKSKKVTLIPLDKINSRSHDTTSRPRLTVWESHCHNLADLPDHQFHISTTSEGKELKQVISTIDPKEVYFFGPYAKEYAQRLSSSANAVRTLFPSHLPSLF